MADFEGPAPPRHCLRRLEPYLYHAWAGWRPWSLHLALPRATQEQSFDSCTPGYLREVVLLMSSDLAVKFYRASNQSAAVTPQLERLSVIVLTPSAPTRSSRSGCTRPGYTGWRSRSSRRASAVPTGPR